MALRFQVANQCLGLRAFSTSSKLTAAAATQDSHVKKLSVDAHTKNARPELELFKQINKLARERRWNSLEHKPVRLLFGEKAKEPYSVYREKIYNNKYHRFSEQWANGKEVEAVLRLIGFFAGVWLIITVYDHFVPEVYRFKYKYGIKQQLEEKAKHGDSHGHH